MSSSATTSTPRSCAQTPSAYKSSHATPSEQSYFSVPYSTIPVSTPFASTSAPLSSYPRSDERPFSSEPAMLDNFAARFPPPPSLTLPTPRHQTQDSFTPLIIPLHRCTSLGGPFPATDRAHKSPAASSCIPTMEVSSSLSSHTFRVQLPHMIQSEMITISANKGDKLKVLANAWQLQSDCHYEWSISFAPRDADLSAVQARFEPNGCLTIHVRRIPRL